MNYKPFLLAPAGKDYLWGGERLKTEYVKDLPLTPLAETWECSAHPEGQSVVASGGHAGQTLGEVLRKYPEMLGVHARELSGGELPILVKLIDADQNLSVQVHPDDAYARVHENQSGKTEIWYVLDAMPDASLVYGFAHDITPDTVRYSVANGTLTKYLQYVPVHAGDVFFIPPGTVHAIGAGVLLAEVQQNSNVTYRLYDYGRCDKNGQKRPLHLERALEVASLKRTPPVHQQMRILRYYPGYARETLAHCAYFRVERILLSQRFFETIGKDSFTCILCTNGEGTLYAAGETLPLKKGNCIFAPAGMGEITLAGKLELLWITC